MSFIKCVSVTKEYNGVKALNQVNLEIKQGERVSIMGPSGSGKTTLLNILSCLDKPSRGAVIIGKKDITKLNQKDLTQFRRENVGLVFQQFHLIPYLTAIENVMLAQ